MSDLPHVLVIGCGSIGERHLRCFLNTGRCRAAVCDTNERLVAEVAARYGVQGYTSLEAAAAFPATAWVICTPAHTHLALTRRGLEAGMNVLIEKPLATGLDGVAAVREAMAAHPACHVAVAYVFHAMPWLQELRSALLSGEFGRPRHASLVAGQHFPTFRPAYRDIYYARHESGGGAIQDALTHSVNAMEWLLGPTTRVYCDAAHQVLEGVEVEDTVNLAVRHGDILAGYCYNQFQAPNELELRVHAERGSLALEVHRQRWGWLRHGDSDWTWKPTPAERDDLFTWQAAAFLDGCAGQASPLARFEEGVQTLKFNLAALESARTGLPVEIA